MKLTTNRIGFGVCAVQHFRICTSWQPGLWPERLSGRSDVTQRNRFVPVRRLDAG